MLHDSEAFSRLVKIHQGKIRAYLVRLSKDYAAADDMAQETFIRAFQKLDSYKGEGSFSGWLFRIAHNCFLEQLRKDKRRQQVTDAYHHELEIDTEKYISISTAQLDLEVAMAQLRTEEAAAITLCHSFGFSHQETSEILDTPLGTVKTNIARGKERLRDLLNKEAIAEESVSRQTRKAM